MTTPDTNPNHGLDLPAPAGGATSTPDEIRLPGNANQELRVTLWQYGDAAASETRVLFEIIDHDFPDYTTAIDVPLASVLPLVLALAGTYERRHATEPPSTAHAVVPPMEATR